jgi:D-sedoheptulose 7-phosphate isomerase
VSSWNSYLEKHLEIAALIDPGLLDRFYASLEKAITENRTVYVFGNGGSAATANHFSADLALLKIRTGINCQSVSLNTDLSLSTAIANDLSYTKVISKQLEIFAKAGDIAVGFSASGNSINVIEGLNQANRIGMQPWAILGFNGGQIVKFKDLNIIHFPTPVDYGLVENIHLCLTHFIVDKLIKSFKRMG